MISGIVLLGSLWLAASPPPPLAESVPPQAAALIARLRRPTPADTAYAEVRFVSVLQRPLLLRGELHYGGNDELGKRVDAPYRESTTIAGSDVTVQRDGKPIRHFSLERAPQLQALLASFSALLGGDANRLNSFYAIALESAAGDWRLTLTPRSPTLARQLRTMIVDGRDDDIRCFSLREGDGDASVILLGALAAAKLPDPPAFASLESVCRGGGR